jgi:pilus assembly protein CpaF
MSEKGKANPLSALESILKDPEVTEVMADGYDRVYIEKHGKFIDVPTPFRDEEHLMEVIAAILEPLGRSVNESQPLADARLADGSRVNVVIPPISLTGPALIIRKFSGRMLTVEDLIGFGSWNEEIVQFLRSCVQGRLNIVVAGGTGSGKTAVLNLLAGMIPPDERIVTVENASELRFLPEKFKRLVRLESRPPNLEGKREVSVQDLVLNALRMRPDRIIVGELRSSEVIHLLQAMNTGHDGTMASVHASSPRDVLARLETMVTMADLSVPLLTVRQQMASAIDLITYQERLRDGSRKILKVTEVNGLQGDAIILKDIFEFRQTGVKDGKITGHFTATGHIPKVVTELQESGIDLPLSLLTPS